MCDSNESKKYVKDESTLWIWIGKEKIIFENHNDDK